MNKKKKKFVSYAKWGFQHTHILILLFYTVLCSIYCVFINTTDIYIL